MDGWAERSGWAGLPSSSLSAGPAVHVLPTLDHQIPKLVVLVPQIALSVNDAVNVLPCSTCVYPVLPIEVVDVR
jgi:hypothetical protein